MGLLSFGNGGQRSHLGFGFIKERRGISTDRKGAALTSRESRLCSASAGPIARIGRFSAQFHPSRSGAA